LHRIIDWKPNYSRPSKAAFRKWQVDLDRMLRLDKRTVDEIEAVIDWATTDDFWQPNILSAGKLRKQFDVLQAQMARKGGKGADEKMAAEYQAKVDEQYRRAQAKREAEAAEAEAMTPEAKEKVAADLLAEKNRARATLGLPPLAKGGA